MPDDGRYGRVQKPMCRQKSRWTWSYMNRGGCRFAPGHDGPCKPAKR